MSKVKLEEVVVKKELPDDQHHKQRILACTRASPDSSPEQPASSNAAKRSGQGLAKGCAVKSSGLEEETPKERGSGDDQTLASLIAADPTKQKALVSQRVSGNAGSGPSRPSSMSAAFAGERDPLLRMMQCLYTAPSAAEAERDLFLNVRTADEEALRSLSLRTREFVPALVAFRKKAVDRAILAPEKHVKVSQELIEDSDGQSSSIDFGLTDVDECAESRQSQAAGWCKSGFSDLRRRHLQRHQRQPPTNVAGQVASSCKAAASEGAPSASPAPLHAASASQAKPEPEGPAARQAEIARRRSEDSSSFLLGSKRQKLTS
ncbi:unnamed protein product [Symbiodinium natans]|uniref:Uncharacterized protein n=1 Tax=Symbiodinium natans TaxID=878477 RepID=A0A812TDA7_9DINO|nr:unnamed protein product [Symbiodinium natans]